MFTKYLTGLFCYVCFFTFIGPIYADDAFKFKGGRKRGQISFIKAGGLIVLKTFINDKGPYNFILDSGVGSLNQIPVSQMSLEDINEILTSKDGRQVFIKVRRNKSVISTVITLKKMI